MLWTVIFQRLFSSRIVPCSVLSSSSISQVQSDRSMSCTFSFQRLFSSRKFWKDCIFAAGAIAQERSYNLQHLSQRYCLRAAQWRSYKLPWSLHREISKSIGTEAFVATFSKVRSILSLPPNLSGSCEQLTAASHREHIKMSGILRKGWGGHHFMRDLYHALQVGHVQYYQKMYACVCHI